MTARGGTPDFTGVFAVWRWTCKFCDDFSAKDGADAGTFSTKGDAWAAYKDHRKNCH